MGLREADNVQKVLAALGDLELSMADFYDACGKAWPEDRSFWSNIAKTELHHAEHLIKMAKRLNDNPTVFETDRPISVVTIRTVMHGIRGNILRLEKGELTKERSFLLDSDMEMSILESKYEEMPKTTDAEYRAMMSEITAQTDTHHQLIAGRIEALKGSR
jgi:hypothetical protein